MRFRQRSNKSITTFEFASCCLLCVTIPVVKQVLKESEWCSSNVVRSLWKTRLLLPAKIRASLTMHLYPLVGSFRHSEPARALVGVLGIRYSLENEGKEARVWNMRS